MFSTRITCIKKRITCKTIRADEHGFREMCQTRITCMKTRITNVNVQERHLKLILGSTVCAYTQQHGIHI